MSEQLLDRAGRRRSRDDFGAEVDLRPHQRMRSWRRAKAGRLDQARYNGSGSPRPVVASQLYRPSVPAALSGGQNPKGWTARDPPATSKLRLAIPRVTRRFADRT
jgi:hypothetical protein